jgi:2-succinyl-5-enolpyruvyl-6-hydroxy-3-cyclohexene-1-carboxylate synthase
MFALKALSEIIPGNSCVHLGNSSPVRYAQFFNWRDDIQFFSNRGTAGIDGVTSTTIGMASQTNRPVFLITGDVSFFYDSNAFWNNYKRKNFKVIVLNNKGGNIFKLISGPEETGLLDNYFTTHYNVSIEFLCKAYGIGYYSAKNNKELLSGLEQFLDLPDCAVFEIVTNPEVNTKVWKDYFRTIRMRLDL